MSRARFDVLFVIVSESSAYRGLSHQSLCDESIVVWVIWYDIRSCSVDNILRDAVCA